jgi:signal transduction histidine kinase
MSSPAARLGFAVVCDADNRVCEVLESRAPLPVGVGGAFVDAFDFSSRAKALRLLETVRSQDVAYGWEANIATAEGPRLLRLNAARAGDRVLVVAGEKQAEANDAFAALVTHAGASVPGGRLPAQETLSLYEQLTEVNNRLTSAQRDLHKKNEELRRMLADRARIAAMAVHDLRTPLQVVLQSALLLDRALATPPDSRESRSLAAIRRNAERMVALANDLLHAYAKDIDQLPLSMQPLDLVALARANVEASQAVADLKGVKLAFDCKSAVPRIRGDPHRLEQVLDNLVHNAIKFSPPQATVRVGVEPVGREVVLSVQNEGADLSDDELAALVSGEGAVLRRPGTSGEKGFGLGLSIVRSIAARHGAALRGSAAADGTVTFDLRFPVPPDSRPEA